MAQDFDEIYVLDLGGDVRKNPKLSGTTHNVFGIQIGVSISFFVREKERAATGPKIFYAAVAPDWRKEQKCDFLDQKGDYGNISWRDVQPDKNYTCLTEGLQGDFEMFPPMGTKQAKA